MSQTAIKVKAIAVVDDIILAVCGSILVSLGIEIATDKEFRQSAGKFFYELPGDITRGIEYWANNWVEGEKCIIQFSAEQWKQITGCANGFMKTYYNANGATVTAGSNGHIGFTEESQFTIHLNAFNEEDSPSRSIQNAFLNDMTITFYDPSLFKDTMKIFPVTLDDETTRIYSSYLTSCHIVNVPVLSLRYFKSSLPAHPSSSTTVINSLKFYGDYVSDCQAVSNVSMRFFHNNFNNSNQVFSLFSHGTLPSRDYHKYLEIYTIDDKSCYFIKCKDNNYRFVTYETAFGNETNYEYLSITNSKTHTVYEKFSSIQEFYSVVCEASSLDFPATNERESVDNGVYSGNMSGVHVPSLPDVYNGTDSVSLNIPTTKTSEGTYTADMEAIRTANPSDVLTYEKSIAFPDGVPNVNSSGLASKFPFCIPFDIYNLFAGFSAEASPPKFSIPLKYGDIMDLEFTIDFAQFEQFAIFIRWYIAISFTLGLVLITRKVIGNN